jgi:hypothetical protein
MKPRIIKYSDDIISESRIVSRPVVTIVVEYKCARFDLIHGKAVEVIQNYFIKNFICS